MAPKKIALFSRLSFGYVSRHVLFLGALLLFLGGCTTQRTATRTTRTRLPAPSSTPIVKTYRINQRDLLYRVYNTSEEPFRALLIFIRGASCEGAKAEQIWMKMSTDPLHPKSMQTFRYAVPVNCHDIHVKAVAIKPGHHGRPHSDKRFPWLQWQIRAFQAPFVRLMVYNSSPDHALVFGLNVVGLLCANKQVSMRRFFVRQPLYPGRHWMQNIRMREICEDVRVQVIPLRVKRLAPRRPMAPQPQPQPTQPAQPAQPNRIPGEI
ncbi:MAG: hypothetical protein H6727_19860 [Myxococcales bacterium]|nr:hypothetical protein [Myxococcales bacterium]